MRLMKGLENKIENYIRSYVIAKLHREGAEYRLLGPNDMPRLKRTLRAGDVILIDGGQLVSEWIKVFSYHTWSHCALWIGDAAPNANIVESLMDEVVVLSDIEKYSDLNLRICRPAGVSKEQIRRVVRYAMEHAGCAYDEHNVTQFVHFSFAGKCDPSAPIGRLDENRFTCSSLIAAAYEAAGVPIIRCYDRAKDQYVCFHPTQIQPKDFDLSLNFEVIKLPPFTIDLEKKSGFRRFVSALLGPRAA